MRCRNGSHWLEEGWQFSAESRQDNPESWPSMTTRAFVCTNPSCELITSSLPVIQTRSVRPAWSLPRLGGFITADTAGRLLLLLVE